MKATLKNHKIVIRSNLNAAINYPLFVQGMQQLNEQCKVHLNQMNEQSAKPALITNMQ